MRLDEINELQAALMSLQLTTDDLLKLEKLRLERLQAFFVESLGLCFVHLNQSNHLAICCPNPRLVDQLLDEIEALCWYAWVIVGVTQISIYFVGEEVYKTATRRSSCFL